MGTILGFSSKVESIGNNHQSFDEQISNTIAQGIENNTQLFPLGVPTASQEQERFTAGRPLTADDLPTGKYSVNNAYLLAEGGDAETEIDAEFPIGDTDVNADIVVPSTAMLLGNILGGVLAYQMTKGKKGRIWWTIGGVVAGGIATSLSYNLGRGIAK